MATRKNDPRDARIAELQKLLETKTAEVELLTTHLKAAEERGERLSHEVQFSRQYNDEIRRHNEILHASESRLSTSVTVLSQQVSALMTQNISLRYPSSVVSAANSAFSGDRAATG